MKPRVTIRTGLAAVAALALLTASCGDSGSPTEPNVSPPPVATANIGGTWTGVFFGCSARATFTQADVSVRGTLQVTEPCGYLFDFEGTIHGNTLSGTYTDYEIYKLGADGTVSGSDLEITLTDSFGTVFGRLLLHR